MQFFKVFCCLLTLRGVVVSRFGRLLTPRGVVVSRFFFYCLLTLTGVGMWGFAVNLRSGVQAYMCVLEGGGVAAD